MIIYWYVALNKKTCYFYLVFILSFLLLFKDLYDNIYYMKAWYSEET